MTSFIYDPDYDNEAHDDEKMRKLRPVGRKEAYSADITYGTNNEFMTLIICVITWLMMLNYYASAN